MDNWRFAEKYGRQSGSCRQASQLDTPRKSLTVYRLRPQLRRAACGGRPGAHPGSRSRRGVSLVSRPEMGGSGPLFLRRIAERAKNSARRKRHPRMPPGCRARNQVDARAQECGSLAFCMLENLNCVYYYGRLTRHYGLARASQSVEAGVTSAPSMSHKLAKHESLRG